MAGKEEHHCFRLSLNYFHFFFYFWSQAIFGGYYSKSKTEITLLVFPAFGYSQTRGNQAPSPVQLPALLIRNPFPTIFSDDQPTTPRPFWREAAAPSLRCRARGTGGLPSALPAEPPAEPWAQGAPPALDGLLSLLKLLDQHQPCLGREAKIVYSNIQDNL